MSVLDALPEASVLVFAAELKFVLVGGEALARHGFSAGELENKPCAAALAPDRWSLYEPLYRAALAGEASSVEVDGVGGERRYVVDVGPLRSLDGKVCGGVAVARDVTARRTAEILLDEHRRLLQDVLDSLSTPVSVKDRDRNSIFVNRA
ncbi:MAG: PAS domain-containing protein [Solirubrobacteraceae bacterium]